MKSIRQFAFSTAVLAAAAVAIGLVWPQRLVSQYAAPVNVMNTKAAPALMRDADNAARSPYTNLVAFPLSGFCGQGADTAVPAGKTLVVEFVTTSIGISGAPPAISLTLPGATGPIQYDLPTVFQGNNGTQSTFVGAQTTRIYVPQNNSLGFSVCSANGQPVGGAARVTISGYFITT